MAYVRRHWLSSVLYVFIIVLGLAVWFTPTFVSDGTINEARAQQAAEPQPVDPYLYTRVQKLRQELALTNLNLAAMGYTEETATQILETLKTWCTANQAVLEQHRRDEVKTNDAIRRAVRQINAGTADALVNNTLYDLQHNLVTLYEKRKTRLDGLVSQLGGGMDAYQLRTWRSARANAGLPAQLRYVPDLSNQQRQTIHDGLTDRTSEATLTEVVDQELTFAQKRAVDATALTAALKAHEVRKAEAAVLPTPDLLKPVVSQVTEQLFEQGGPIE